MRSEEIITTALEMVDNDRYKLSLVVAKRAEQLLNGAEPLVDDVDDLKPVDIAIREVAQGKVKLHGIVDTEL